MISLEFDQKSIDGLSARLGGLNPKNQGKAVYKGFVRGCLIVESKLKENVSGSILNVRSGQLRASMGSIITIEKDGLQGTIGSGVRQGGRVAYANLQERGGTIRPKTAQWLTIPLPAAMTASGVARGRARDFDNTFIKKSKAGNLIIFQSKGKSIVPLFILKKSVEIPASHYLSITRDQTRDAANQELINGIQEGI